MHCETQAGDAYRPRQASRSRGEIWRFIYSVKRPVSSLERLRKLNGIHIPRTMLSHRSILISPLQVPIGESAFYYALSFSLPPHTHDRLLETSYAQTEEGFAIGWSAARSAAKNVKCIPKRVYQTPVRMLPTTTIVVDIGQWHTRTLGEAPRNRNTYVDVAGASDPSHNGLPADGPAPTHTEAAHCNPRQEH